MKTKTQTKGMVTSDNAMVLPTIKLVIIESKDLTGSMENFTKALRKIRADFSKAGFGKGEYDHHITLSLIKKPLFWQRIQPDFEKDLEKVLKEHVKSFSRVVWE
ncbi:hypothetical protein [Chryseobacterium sp. SL1]|uniref:hypothetical protein n=1 Tax=Chryseobacterium sp. SL1 TaxID=2995159 RepID=UPI0022727030|nr:hypothetical protein [Chryseobacterium sp. SL1]MCY1660130.1 hypothetical protein [Chryseobacterium sp. SL1]